MERTVASMDSEVASAASGETEEDGTRPRGSVGDAEGDLFGRSVGGTADEKVRQRF